MIRINRETDYGIAILSLLARHSGERLSASGIAQQQGLPQPVVSKILKQLAHDGIVLSFRGAKGGYGLARPADRITVADIIAALEGPIALTECADQGPDACQYGDHCHVSGNWERINRVVREALERISLAEMSSGPSASHVFPLEFTGVRYVGDH